MLGFVEERIAERRRVLNGDGRPADAGETLLDRLLAPDDCAKPLDDDETRASTTRPCAEKLVTSSACARHAAELAAESVPVNVVQRQLGHGSLAMMSSLAGALEVFGGHRWEMRPVRSAITGWPPR